MDFLILTQRKFKSVSLYKDEPVPIELKKHPLMSHWKSTAAVFSGHSGYDLTLWPRRPLKRSDEMNY